MLVEHSFYPCSFFYLYILPCHCNIKSGPGHVRTCLLKHFPIVLGFDLCYLFVKILYILILVNMVDRLTNYYYYLFIF